jgi:NAD(P)-dependent dehydrogenase (short-subunit alcohol dehydrogenase family)
MSTRSRGNPLFGNTNIERRYTSINNANLHIMMTSSPVALITAGSAGLGAAAAKLFAASGYRVVINYSSNKSRADEVVGELYKLSPVFADLSHKKIDRFIAIQADLAKRDEIVRLVDETTKVMGRLDVLFSNGGWTMVRNFQDLDDNMEDDDWDRCFNMNVKSHLWLMHAARTWLDESEGAFITTASMAGLKPSGSSLVRLLAFRFISIWKLN